MIERSKIARASAWFQLSAAAQLTAAALLFGAMVTCAKRLSLRLPGQEIACLRFSCGLIACAVAATRVKLRVQNWRGLSLRALFGAVAVFLFFLAIEHLPVGIATLLNNTSPVFTALWAVIFLREPIGLRALLALLLTMAGVTLVIWAQAIPGTLGFGTWELVGLASAMLSGAAVATIREVRKTDGSWEIFGSFCLVGAIITAIPSASIWIPPSSTEWGWVLLMGVVSVLAQLFMTHALRYARATVAGLLTQLTPISALVLGWIFFGEHMSALALFGAALTIVGVGVTLLGPQ